jgi:hypothetical protein
MFDVVEQRVLEAFSPNSAIDAYSLSNLNAHAVTREKDIGRQCAALAVLHPARVTSQDNSPLSMDTLTIEAVPKALVPFAMSISANADSVCSRAVLRGE